MEDSGFEVGRVIDSKIFDSLPDLVAFVEKLNIPKIEIEKRKLKVQGKDWYLDALRGRKVVGVDGSQLRHLKEFGIPFGAVQVAKFAVDHGKGDYGLAFKSKWVGLDQNLDFERFSLEVEMIMEEMGRESYVFYDGSLVLSFVSQLRRDLRERYFESVNLMLEKSEETSTPLFGFVEKSYARDISDAYYDSFVLRESLGPLEYTRPMVCERDVAKNYKRKVCFSYLCLNRFSIVRVEFPEWMVDETNGADETDEMGDFMKIVAAECMIGSTRSYPYVLERAHRYAVIREVEREAVGRIFSKLGGASLKWVSKKMG